MSRHSNDLRKRAIAFFKSNKTKSETIKTFQIARQTLYDWIELEKQSKLFDILPKKNGFKSSVDLAELKKYIDENPDKYYHEIALKFGVKKSQIQRIVTQKLGYTSKKNKQFTEKQTNKPKKNLNKQ